MTISYIHFKIIDLLGATFKDRQISKYSMSQLWGISEIVFDATKNTNSSIH
jgi:hypothetical protein